jgi:hypothetical protein
MTEKKPNGNPQTIVRSPPKLLEKMRKKAKAKGMAVSRWLLSLAAIECGYNHPLPVRGSAKKGKRQ